MSVSVKAKTDPRVLLKVEWDRSKKVDCDLAESIYQDQRRAGNTTVFAADRNWLPTEQLQKFDRKLGRMVVIPRQTVWDKLNNEISST